MTCKHVDKLATLLTLQKMQDAVFLDRPHECAEHLGRVLLDTEVLGSLPEPLRLQILDKLARRAPSSSEAVRSAAPALLSACEKYLEAFQMASEAHDMGGCDALAGSMQTIIDANVAAKHAITRAVEAARRGKG